MLLKNKISNLSLISLKKITFIFTSIICLYSCTGQNDKSKILVESERKKYIIPDSLYSFFPDIYTNIENLYLISTNAEEPDFLYEPEEFEVVDIVKIYEYKNLKLLDSLKNVFSNKSLYKTKSENNNYKIIGSERGLLNLYDSIIIKKNYQNFDNPLILNFREIQNSKRNIFDSSTICGIKSGFEIFVLKTGNKYVLPNKGRYEWSLLPNKLKHGYSAGVAFNKTEPFIIYWVVAW